MTITTRMAKPQLRLRDVDGNININLLDPNTISIANWRNVMATARDDGQFSFSALSDMARLVGMKYALVSDSIPVNIKGKSANDFARTMQVINRAFVSAMKYFLDHYNDNAIYLERRLSGESDPVYAVIQFGQMPESGSLFGDQFSNYFDAGQLQLSIRRMHWTKNRPGESDCVPLANYREDNEVEEQDQFFCGQSSDDAEYEDGTPDVATGGTIIRLGNDRDVNYDGLIRFRDVQVAQGATILDAYITLTATATDSGDDCCVEVHGEDNSSPDPFSTVADYTGRTDTAASKSFTLSHWTAGGHYELDGLEDIVQEIVNRGDWSSGDDMAFFIREDGASYNAFRRFASWDNSTFDEPKLTIVWEGGTWTSGIDPDNATCESDLRLANFHKEQQITHIFTYDDSTGLYSANLAGESSHDLLPDPPDDDDILYVGIASTADINYTGFWGLVFDLIASSDASLDGAWQYSIDDAPPWLAFQEETCDGTDAFKEDGVRSVHWGAPRGTLPGPVDLSWHPTTVNGVEAYWVRFIVTSVGGSPDAPQQQNRPVYTPLDAFVEVADDEIFGDIEALAHHIIICHSGCAGETYPEELAPRQVFLGLRDYERGENFNPFINLSGEENPDGITVAYGSNTSKSDWDLAPTLSAAKYNPAGADSFAERARIEFSSSLAREYRGRYHVFLRCYQDSGNDDAFQVRIKFEVSDSEIVAHTTDIESADEGERMILDFGGVYFPDVQSALSSDDLDGCEISIEAKCIDDTDTPDFYLIDLVLMPTDQWAAWAESPGDPIVNNREYHLDSVTSPKRFVRSILYMQDGDARSEWTSAVSDYVQYDRETRQRLWALFFNEDEMAAFEICNSLQSEVNWQYLTTIGREGG